MEISLFPTISLSRLLMGDKLELVDVYNSIIKNFENGEKIKLIEGKIKKIKRIKKIKKDQKFKSSRV